jgi:hypothetical protein
MGTSESMAIAGLREAAAAGLVPGTVISLPAGIELTALAERTVPTIESVLGKLHERPPVNGTYLRKDVECRLKGDEADLLKRIFAEINHQGGNLRRPGDVFGWLLRSIAQSLEPYQGEPSATVNVRAD